APPPRPSLSAGAGVWGRAVRRAVDGRLPRNKQFAFGADAGPAAAVAAELDSQAVRTLRRAMTAKVGVIRDDTSLVGALGVIAGLEQGALSNPRLDHMLVAAKLIATAALMRKESRGAHFRSTYLEADPKYSHPT